MGPGTAEPSPGTGPGTAEPSLGTGPGTAEPSLGMGPWGTSSVGADLQPAEGNPRGESGRRRFR